jgi:hypothetical protein
VQNLNLQRNNKNRLPMTRAAVTDRTNAQRQARWRAKRNALAKQAGTDKATIARLRQQLKAAKATIKKLTAKRAAMALRA